MVCELGWWRSILHNIHIRSSLCWRDGKRARYTDGRSIGGGGRGSFMLFVILGCMFVYSPIITERFFDRFIEVKRRCVVKW